MAWCMDHWTRLREAIDKRGLTSLISESGEEAAKKMVSEINEGEQTIDNFDPLLSAYWAIQGNAGRILEGIGGNPLYILVDGPEDIVEGYGPENAWRTWPRCPICYLSLAHELTCSEPRCELPKKNGYDWMLDKAADESLERWRKMGST